MQNSPRTIQCQGNGNDPQETAHIDAVVLEGLVDGVGGTDKTGGIYVWDFETLGEDPIIIPGHSNLPEVVIYGVRPDILPGTEGPGRGGPSLQSNPYVSKAYEDKKKELEKIVKPGKLHKKANQCEVFKKMWEDSFKDGVAHHENAALITNKGILWLPNFNNSQTQSRLDYYQYRREPNNTVSVKFYNEWINVLGVIHTHPNGYSRGPSISKDPNGQDDYVLVKAWNVPNFVLNPQGELWMGIFDNDGKKAQLLINNNFKNCGYNIYDWSGKL
ncbi:hypothetical protein GCM10027347_07500 [Larkinella harenae]